MSHYVSASGNLTETPTLRQTNTGKQVTTVKVAVNHRVKDGDEWTDGSPSFFELECWERLAVNVCESLVRGDRITFSGMAHVEVYSTPDGRRSKTVVRNASIGVSLDWATVTITRNAKRSDEAA